MSLDFIAGCLGATAGIAVGHPFDTIKVRLQTQDAHNPRYLGTWHCLTRTIQGEAVQGLYKGISSPVAAVAAVNAIVFGVHGNLMKHMSDPNAISSQVIAGAGAGFTQAFIVSPMELVKTRVQVQSNTAASALTKYKSPLHCIKKILKTEGLRGIFRGQTITLIREVPGFATYFSTYEYFVRKLSDEDDYPTTGAILLSGGLAGTSSWVLTYPIDVIKSRLQADGREGYNKYKGILHCFKVSVTNEGPGVLTKGLSTTLLRAFPTSAATFAVVSMVMDCERETDASPDDGNGWHDVLMQGEAFLSAASSPYASVLNQQQQLSNLEMFLGSSPPASAFSAES